MNAENQPNSYLEKLIRPERFLFLTSNKKKAALEELIGSLSKAPEVKSAQELTEKIFERESLMSTGIGFGIAVPHVRIGSVQDLVLAGGISKTGIEDYESLDGQPVKIIFMIAARPDQHADYIRLLSQISNRLKIEKVREKLLHCETSEEACEILLK